MRGLMISVAALALAGCGTAYGDAGTATATAVPPPAVTQSMPEQMASLDPSDSILFWSDERRSAVFRDMEGSFPGLEVAPASTVRELPRSAAPLPASLQAELREYMAETQAAGLMVLKDGEVLFEDYCLGFGPTGRWTSFSVAKSFTSTLLGAAIADGAIASVDTPVTEIIPALAGTAYDGVSVGQIATMTSGVAWNEDYTDPDSDVAKMLAVAPVAGESQAVTYARTLTREAPAGEKWVYKTLETNLLGLIVEQATGQSLAAYAAEKIVEPAGLEVACSGCRTSPAAISVAAACRCGWPTMRAWASSRWRAGRAPYPQAGSPPPVRRWSTSHRRRPASAMGTSGGPIPAACMARRASSARRSPSSRRNNWWWPWSAIGKPRPAARTATAFAL